MTGTRADYPRIKPVLKILREKNIELKLFVTGQHVEKNLDLQLKKLKKDKFKIFKKAKIFQMMIYFRNEFCISQMLRCFFKFSKEI